MITKNKQTGNISEIQKAAEWVRHARTNHALYGDASSEAELVAALKDFAEAQKVSDK